MIVLARIADFEGDGHFRIEGLQALCAKVSGSIETQPISAAQKRHFGGDKIIGTPVFIGSGVCKTLPVVSGADIQGEGNAGGGTAPSRVKNVSGYADQVSPWVLKMGL